MKKKVSIKEIAALSGVSVATVSRVINNNGRFTEETRVKVLKVIEETGYETNYVAKSLRMKKSNTVGIMVPDISNAFFSSLVRKLESQLFEEGYSAIICNTDRSTEKEMAYLSTLESKMVDGLIVISGQKEFSQANLTRKIPVICIDRKPQDELATILIHSDNFMGGVVATEELIQKGCKNIALLANVVSMSSFKYRREGFAQTLDANKDAIETINYIEITQQPGLSQTEIAKDAVSEYLKAGNICDGIFAVNDRLAIGAIEAAHEFGLKIPEDIKIVGFDNDPISKYCFPKLTTVRQDTQKLSEIAFETLLNLIDGIEPEKKQIVIPINLIKRQTT